MGVERKPAPTPFDAAWWEAHIARMERVTENIRQHIRSTGEKQGVLTCECGKPLHYRQSPRNGHISASCETADCVNFME